MIRGRYPRSAATSLRSWRRSSCRGTTRRERRQLDDEPSGSRQPADDVSELARAFGLAPSLARASPGPTPPMTGRLRLAILGCGAVAELCHVPGSRHASRAELAVFVDRDRARARAMADLAGGGQIESDWTAVLDRVDGVINALPHHLHADVTIHCLEKGVPVLVEKPMALTARDARAMTNTAEATGTVLQVAFMNRFCEGARTVRRAISEHWLGPLVAVDVEWGFEYDWPVASGFFFSREQAGGGVLVDLGSHVLDLLQWWIGPADLVRYSDDDLAGVEADCLVELTARRGDRYVPCRIELSRQRNLRNTLRVVGEEFTIECVAPDPTSAVMWRSGDDSDQATVFETRRSPGHSLDQAYGRQLDAFADAIVHRDESPVPGRSVVPTVELIERCYAARVPLRYPWEGE